MKLLSSVQRRLMGLTLLVGVMLAGISQPVQAKETRAPNVVIIFLDDSGFGDFRPFGNPPYPTPHVEALTAEGGKFTGFYVPQGICSASRSALLTGLYPGRTKVFGAFGPKARGLDPKYQTMGQVMQRAGYTTALFGKWHLGDQPETRSHARGFDETSGLMYSNDMWEFHPDSPEYWGKFPLQYWKNGKVTIERVTHDEQQYLTKWYTEDAVDFIGRHKDEPFFLYVPHSMPHVPIYASPQFKGKSGVGLYGDVMMELDWSVGQINQAIKDAGLEDDTIVMLTSDNGPWVSYGNHAGVTPYREAKATGFDGGTRSACVIKYPRSIKAGFVNSRTFSSVDLLPTLTSLTGAKLPDYEIDGKNVWPLITGQAGATSGHDYYPFSTGKTFEGVISGDGKWKLHLPHSYRTLDKPAMDGASGKYKNVQIELSLFNLAADPGETTNVIESNPSVAAQMQAWAKSHKARFFSPKKK